MSLLSLNRKNIGILVLEEFIGDLRSFMRAACPQTDFPNTVYVRWQDPSKRGEDGIHMYYGRVLQKEYEVHLFSPPEALSRDFAVSDLQFPVRIYGSVLIMGSDVSFPGDQALYESVEKNPKVSALAWIRIHHLPFVIAALNSSTSSSVSLEQLRYLLNLEAYVPIVSCPSEFDANHVDHLLSILIEQIEAGRD